MSAQSGNLLNKNETINYKGALNRWWKVNILNVPVHQDPCLVFIFNLFISQRD